MGSSFGDSTQISDLSGISRISCSTAIRPSTRRIDFTVDASESTRVPRSRSSRDVTNRLPSVGPMAGTASNIIRITKLIDSCEDAISNRAKLELLYECVREMADGEANDGDETRDAAGREISMKLKSIVTSFEIAEYLRLPSTEKDDRCNSNLLGIVDTSWGLPLDRQKKREIAVAVESSFRRKIDDFVESYEKSGGNVAEILRCRESAGKMSLPEGHEMDVMRWSDPTGQVCASYYRDLLTCADLLCQWRQLKYIELRELNMKKAEKLLLQSQIAEVQTEISRITCATRMFNETSCTMDAFRIMSENLDARICNAKERIRKMEILKMNYEDVSCAEYDQFLNKYTELCSVIRKKEHLMEML